MKAPARSSPMTRAAGAEQARASATRGGRTSIMGAGIGARRRCGWRSVRPRADLPVHFLQLVGREVGRLAHRDDPPLVRLDLGDRLWNLGRDLRGDGDDAVLIAMDEIAGRD